MPLVAFFLFLNVVLIAAHFHARWKQQRDPAAPPKARRLSPANLRSFGIRQGLLVFILVATFQAGWWDAESVGVVFPAGQPQLDLNSVLAGELGFLALILGYTLLIAVAGRIPVMRLAATRGNLLAWPRKRSHKFLAVLFIMVLNPFTEELVMRGILIHQWSLYLDSPVIPVALGFVFNSLLHWYQGWRMQLWHALYFALAVTLLYQWDLVAAITAHVFGDVVPFLGMKTHLKRARAEKRKARAARSAHTAQPA